MSRRTVQKFSKDHVVESSKMSPTQRAQFLEEFMNLSTISEADKTSKSKLISIKIPEDLLRQFKVACTAKGTPYQTMIKKLMREWLLKT